MKAEQTHRIVFRLRFQISCKPRGQRIYRREIIVPLNRDGMAVDLGRGGAGLPREPKRRTIDLRIGDSILCDGRWANILRVTAEAEGLTAQQAGQDMREGYIYQIITPAVRGALMREAERTAAEEHDDIFGMGWGHGSERDATP